MKKNTLVAINGVCFVWNAFLCVRDIRAENYVWAALLGFAAITSFTVMVWIGTQEQ